MVSSTTPRLEARWPPLRLTVSTMRERISAARGFQFEISQLPQVGGSADTLKDFLMFHNFVQYSPNPRPRHVGGERSPEDKKIAAVAMDPRFDDVYVARENREVD
jgi:hypothetical protein